MNEQIAYLLPKPEMHTIDSSQVIHLEHEFVKKGVDLSS